MRESTIKDSRSAIVARNFQSEDTFVKQNKLGLGAVSQRLPLINPEASQSKLYESIVDINKNYLAEKVKVCEVKKPQQYEHKLPSKTGVSEYNRRYAGWKRSVSLAGTVPEADKSGSLMKQPNAQITNFKTNYQVDYSPQRINCLNGVSFDSKIKNQKVAYRDQRPFYKETAYQRDFSIRQSICTDQPAKRLETLRTGGKFSSQTTYKQAYPIKNNLKTMPNQPILPIEHKIFVKVGESGKSNYQQSYLQRQILNEGSFKPQARQLPQFKSMGLKSEYKKVYEQKQHRRHTDFECLDEQKLRQYVLGLSQS